MLKSDKSDKAGWLHIIECELLMGSDDMQQKNKNLL
jgi:hypothetical protein